MGSREIREAFNIIGIEKHFSSHLLKTGHFHQDDAQERSFSVYISIDSYSPAPKGSHEYIDIQGLRVSIVCAIFLVR